jgi:hypothetical protein
MSPLINLGTYRCCCPCTCDLYPYKAKLSILLLLPPDRFLRKMEDILDSDYAYQNRFVPAEPADSR